MGLKRFSVELDQKLIKNCVSITGINSLNSLISHALQELLRRDSRAELLQLKGQIAWDGDLASWRQEREK